MLRSTDAFTAIDWAWLTVTIAFLLGALLHRRLGIAMYEQGEPFPALSSSRWVPDRRQPRQMLLLGMYFVAVPSWIEHGMLVLAGLLCPSSIRFLVGAVVTASMAWQMMIAFIHLGMRRRPAVILLTEYLVCVVVSAI